MKKGIDYIGVGCGVLIVNEKDAVILLKRTDKCTAGGEGMRTRPGGSIKFGETITEALKRETMEELGVEIELFGPILYLDDIREENGKKIHWSTGGSFGKIIKGTVINMEPEKHEKIEWFNINDLPKNVAKYTMHGIEEYKKYKNI